MQLISVDPKNQYLIFEYYLAIYIKINLHHNHLHKYKNNVQRKENLGLELKKQDLLYDLKNDYFRVVREEDVPDGLAWLPPGVVFDREVRDAGGRWNSSKSSPYHATVVWCRWLPDFELRDAAGTVSFASAHHDCRDGHVGANLALLGDRAVGRRVRVHWPNERDCFRGVVSGFDRETWPHSLEYDDGDVEPAIRLWREVVHLGVPEDERADREEATREARRGKVWSGRVA